MENIISLLCKLVMASLGMLVAILEPTIPFIIICTLAVFMDCYTAWSLSRRVKKRFPGANDGKFKSKYAGNVFATLIKIYAIVVLTHLVDMHVFPDLYLRLPNIVAGAVCFWQIWSMLENESSCNNAKWAKIAQRIMVDKTERHFDLDLHELKSNTDNPLVDFCGHTQCANRDNCTISNAKFCPGHIPPKVSQDNGTN